MLDTVSRVMQGCCLVVGGAPHHPCTQLLNQLPARQDGSLQKRPPIAKHNRAPPSCFCLKSCLTFRDGLLHADLQDTNTHRHKHSMLCQRMHQLPCSALDCQQPLQGLHGVACVPLSTRPARCRRGGCSDQSPPQLLSLRSYLPVLDLALVLGLDGALHVLSPAIHVHTRHGMVSSTTTAPCAGTGMGLISTRSHKHGCTCQGVYHGWGTGSCRMHAHPAGGVTRRCQHALTGQTRQSRSHVSGRSSCPP